ncbi:MAG: hypothetical protein ACKO38_00855 [Planctomycetota bacterium]
MAKGNDGNYLQHSIEIAVAWQLVSRTAGNHLHIALTHGMAPYELTGRVPNGQTKAQLFGALAQSRNRRLDGEAPIISAYRASNANLNQYPNTGELLASVIGRNCLAGGITETDPDKQAQLKTVWGGSNVNISSRSWRLETTFDGVLSCPEALSMPWLFSSDPMTYHEQGEADDDQLYRADFDRLADVLTRYGETGKPGAACLFVYSVRPRVRPLFWSFAEELAGNLGADLTTAWMTHQGGNRNLAAILSFAAMLPPGWLPEGISNGR